jgi:pimeloyl-ACP methyl ester carboxylesterase
VHYQIAGQGAPVILVHGLCGSTLWWKRNVAALARSYRVYLVDLPGFGSMRRARGGFVLERSASWLLMWMEAAGVMRAHFIGHSMGGAICMQLAALHPDVVSRLVLVSPAVMLPLHSLAEGIIPLLMGIKHLTPSFSCILLYDGLRAGPVTFLRAARDLLMQDLCDDMQMISAPTLLIWGEDDTQVPASLGPVLRQKLADARLLTLKKAGHVSMFQRPDEFNSAVLAFLGGQAVGR